MHGAAARISGNGIEMAASVESAHVLRHRNSSERASARNTSALRSNDQDDLNAAVGHSNCSITKLD
jgi:hypothetical protein